LADFVDGFRNGTHIMPFWRVTYIITRSRKNQEDFVMCVLEWVCMI
jgi:hypothetical protein